MTRNTQVSDIEEVDDIPVWRNRRVIKKIAIWITILAGVVVFGLSYGYPKFREFRRNRILGSARAFIEAQNFRSAFLLLDQFVKEDPGNLEAHRLLAQVLEAQGPGQGLSEWETLTRIEPRNPANSIGFATAALQAGQIKKLADALMILQKLQPQGVEYYRLTAGLALAKGDTVALRRTLEVLVDAEPGNEVMQLNLAILRFSSTQPADLMAARGTLEKFARGNHLRIRATLALIDDVSRRWPGESNPAKRYALLARQLELGRYAPDAAGEYMSLELTNRREPGLPDLVEHMKSQKAPLPDDAAALAQWMLKIGQKGEALVWLETLDEKLRQSPAVKNAMATCAVSLESWPRLEQLLRQGAWGPVPPDAVRFAFQSHERSQVNNDSRAESLWNKAVQLSEQSLPGLRMLHRLAQLWRWPRRSAQVLWALVRQYPADLIAWQKLSEQALANHDTAEVWRIYGAWAQAAPADIRVRIERVVIGLLVRPHEPGLAGQAEELFRLHPDNAGCRLAQALALWRGTRTGEALAVLDAGGLNYAAEPRLALARGLMLASAGRREESEKMLAAVPTELLLPEEIALMAGVRAGRK